MENLNRSIIITNNPLVNEKYNNICSVEFYEVDYLGILKNVRDYIHRGHILLTHPLSGSVKPNETPYKTIIVKKDRESLDFKSLKIIEDSIATTKKFLENEKTPCWNERILKDFQVIDLSLIENAIDKML